MENEKVATSIAAFFQARIEKEQRQRGEGSPKPMLAVMPMDTKIKFEQPSWFVHFLFGTYVFGLIFFGLIGHKLVGDKVRDPTYFVVRRFLYYA